MYFISTANPSSRIDCQTAMLSAYAPDGGLLLPGEIPKVSRDELLEMSKMSYITLLSNLMSRFLDSDFNSNFLEEILGDMPEKFASKDEMVPVKDAELDGGIKIKVAELFHGPSLAFKDLATIPACRLMDVCLGKGNYQKALVVVSTSGDTGASTAGAIEGTANLNGLILIPGNGRVSKIQELLTVTWPDPKVQVYSADATSDELDILAGRFQQGSPLCDSEILSLANKHKVMLTSLNSLNPIRVLAQLTPFFYVYLKTCPTADKKVCIILPTGGGGNLSAGLLARKMGLPIEIVVSLNKNASLPRLIDHVNHSKSAYDVPISVPSFAPAMDMGMPYNLPRIVHLLEGFDSVKFSTNASTGKQQVEISKETLNNIQSTLYGIESASDLEIETTMKMVASLNNGYSICPHTATAVSAALKLFKTSDHKFAGVVAMATASPLKFIEVVEKVGLPESVSEARKLADRLDSLPKTSHDLSLEDGSTLIPYDTWFKSITSHLKKSIFA